MTFLLTMCHIPGDTEVVSTAMRTLKGAAMVAMDVSCL